MEVGCVSKLEYAALLDLDRMIRLAMNMPGAGEFLVAAIQALDTVRREEGLPIPDNFTPPPSPQESAPEVSKLAAGLIRKAMKK